jgi:large subunit ribosomal protein L3
LLGHFKKANADPKKFVREFRLPDGTQVDGDLNLSVNQFVPGEFVDVIGRSKGKGFQGVVKKHGFAGQPAAHGSKTHRRNGAVGNRSTPGRIWKNMGMPGHMGDDRVTVKPADRSSASEENTLFAAQFRRNGSYVVVRPAKKKQMTRKSMSVTVLTTRCPGGKD